MVIVRVISWSLLTAALAAWLGFILYGLFSDWVGISILLSCVGGIIGAVAAAAQEMVTALRHGGSN